MNQHRATFTLDEKTARALRRCAERLGKAKSEVVRDIPALELNETGRSAGGAEP